jgi:hypothetical protein
MPNFAAGSEELGSSAPRASLLISEGIVFMAVGTPTNSVRSPWLQSPSREGQVERSSEGEAAAHGGQGSRQLAGLLRASLSRVNSSRMVVMRCPHCNCIDSGRSRRRWWERLSPVVLQGQTVALPILWAKVLAAQGQRVATAHAPILAAPAQALLRFLDGRSEMMHHKTRQSQHKCAA